MGIRVEQRWIEEDEEVLRYIGTFFSSQVNGGDGHLFEIMEEAKGHHG